MGLDAQMNGSTDSEDETTAARGLEASSRQKGVLGSEAEG